MPLSATSAFSDPREFHIALYRIGIRGLIPVQACGFRARLTDIRLDRLELLAAREGTSRVATMSAPADRMLMVFPTIAEGTHYWAEHRLSLGELVVLYGAERTTWRICAPVRWGAILLPEQMLADCLRIIIGNQAHMPPPGLSLWRPRWPAFRGLLKLHHAAVRYTVHLPEAPVETEAAHGLEQELLTAMVESLTDMSATCD